MQTSNSFDQLASLFQNFPPIQQTLSSNSLLPTDDAKEAIMRNYSSQISHTQSSLNSAFKTAMESLENHLETTISARYRDKLSHLTLLEKSTTELSRELDHARRAKERFEVIIDTLVDPDAVVKKRVMAAFKSLINGSGRKNGVIVKVCARDRMRRVLRAWRFVSNKQASGRRAESVLIDRESEVEALRLEYSSRIDAVNIRTTV
jgi:DUF438 domain-containing protein